MALLPLSSFSLLPSSHPSLPASLLSFQSPTTTGNRARRSAAARRLARPPQCLNSSAQAEASAGDGISRATLLWRAAKLPIYSVALVPLTVGSSSAYLQTGLFFARRYIILLSASIMVITWLNLSNDVYDFDTGADRNKKESVVNIIDSQRVTQIAANISLTLGLMGLLWVSAEAREIRFILLVTLTYAILCGYVYQCPPFRFSYLGLGEPLFFAAFGPFATTAFYYSCSCGSLLSGASTLPFTRTVLCVSFLVGLNTTLILFCSHFHQIEGDLAVGKMSPLVRIGTEAGSRIVKYAVISLYFLLFAFGLIGALPLNCVILSALTIPVGKMVVDYVQKNHYDESKIFMAKYYCVRLHALFGTALALGLFLSRTGTIMG